MCCCGTPTRGVCAVTAGGVRLADDLRDVYLTAQRTEIAWVVLQQTAKAIRDAALLELVQQCHEETQQTATWLRSRIKESAAQVYATS